jgi:undecaprenyl-diphosphatase
MELIRAIVLGVVQGLTEFLPISSSAHLRIVPELFGWPDPGAAFTAVIQLGTMAAVILYFWSDLWKIALTWLRSLRDRSLRGELEARMGWYLIIATVPIVIFGVAFKDQIETGARDLRLVGTMLILFGVILYIADRSGREDRELDQLNTTDGVSIGLAQSLALIPGVSRSGATITAGLFRGFTREAAARFSFLLSVPAVVLSGVYELKDAGSGSYGVGATVLATILAFVVGYAAIAWFLRFLVNHTVLVFVVYRVALGVLVLTLVAAGSIKANTPALGDYLGTLKR